MRAEVYTPECMYPCVILQCNVKSSVSLHHCCKRLSHSIECVELRLASKALATGKKLGARLVSTEHRIVINDNKQAHVTCTVGQVWS
jgi:hypothetical protein